MRTHPFVVAMVARSGVICAHNVPERRDIATATMANRDPKPRSSRVRLPSISFIVARSYPGNVIGYKGKLPWHISSDLKRFRKITTGHAIIMGRTTFDSIGRALPNRTNIVMSKKPRLSNSPSFAFDELIQLYWTATREDALFVADIISIMREVDDVFVVGGQTMYELFSDIVNRVYLTEVFADVQGDTFFMAKFPIKQWKCLDEQDYSSRAYEGDQFGHRFSIYERRDRKFRYKFLTNFYTDQTDKLAWIDKQLKLNDKKILSYIQEHLEI
jgi:dihydrofolate reductase